jgi:hypothetical protein
MPAHEGHGVKPGIGMVPGVKADLQDAFVHLVQQRSSSGSKSMKPAAWAWMPTVRPYPRPPASRHGRDPVAEGGPFGGVHLFGLLPARRRRPAGRDGIDQHQMPRAMRHQRLAGADRGVHHLVPLRRVVERAEHHAADQRQPFSRQRFAQDGGSSGMKPIGPSSIPL